MADLHLYPLNDAIEHDTCTRECVCGVEIQGDVVFHRALLGGSIADSGAIGPDPDLPRIRPRRAPIKPRPRASRDDK